MKGVTRHPRRLLAMLGIAPRKGLGQSFLHDGNVARKIVKLALDMGGPFLEIGPGLGALTDLLAETERETVAIEVDRALAAFLRGRFEGTSVKIIEADFLSLPDGDFSGWFPGGGTVVGNLPYALSSPILIRLLTLRETFPCAVLMLQKEVVERLCAKPGKKDYGILSVYLSVLGEAREEFSVRRTCFTPSPEVDSSVITIRFRRGISDDILRALQTVVRAAFAQRRKTLRNAPVPFLQGGSGEWCDLLSGSGIDPSARAETVAPEQYLQLARAFKSLRGAPERPRGKPNGSGKR